MNESLERNLTTEELISLLNAEPEFKFRGPILAALDELTNLRAQAQFCEDNHVDFSVVENCDIVIHGLKEEIADLKVEIKEITGE